jgi:hypothetical protein
MLHGMKTGKIELPNAKPTIVMWNSAIWKTYKPEESDTVRQIAKAARELVESSGHLRPRLFWKESTARYMGKNTVPCDVLEDDKTMQKVLVQEQGWGVLPYARMTNPFLWYLPEWSWPANQSSPYFDVWWDALHFNPYVYEELNQVLLREICGE